MNKTTNAARTSSTDGQRSQHAGTGPDRRAADRYSPSARDEALATERVRDQMQQLAWLFDESIPIPFLGIRVGVDGLLGLLPGVGDLISTGISSFIIRQAAVLGVPKVVLLRMAFNTAIDFVVGAIPLVGDLFDIGWKANKRNVQLVVEHLDNPSATRRSSWLSVLGMSGAIVALVTVAIVAIGSLLAAIIT